MDSSAQSAQSLPRENAGPQMSPQHPEQSHQTQWARWQNPDLDRDDRRNIRQNSESLLPAQPACLALQPPADTHPMRPCSWQWHTDAMRLACALLPNFPPDWAKQSFVGVQSSTSSPTGHATTTMLSSSRSSLTLSEGWRRPCIAQPTQRYALVLPLSEDSPACLPRLAPPQF